MKRFLALIIILTITFNANSAFAAWKTKDSKQPVKVDEISEQAKVLYVQNDIDGALKILTSKKEDDRSALDWLILGNIMQDKNKITEAIYMYNHSISTDEKFYKAHYNLGYIYLIQDKPNMAISEFKKAVKYNPAFSYGYYNMGCAYLKLKNYKTARYNFFRALDLKANNPDIYYNIAYSYKMLNNEKKAQTYLDLYNKMMEQHEL